MVAAGDKLASSQWAELADKMNRILLLGAGDPTWRIHYAFESIVHAIRNRDADGNFPAEHEALQYYALVDPAEASWPTAPPGEYEGANVANSIAAFIFGSEAQDLYDEASRLSDFPSAQSISGPADAWSLAKQQRGGYDADALQLSSPWWDLATACAKVLSKDVRRDRTFGGLLPGQGIQDTPCDDPNTGDTNPPPVNYIVRFLPLREGLSAIEFPGTCQPGPDIDPPDKYDDHVASITTAPISGVYQVIRHNAQVTVISMADYVLDRSGPGHWSGASLWGILYALQWYACSFRGTADEIGQIIAGTLPPGDPLTPWLSGAFDFQTFFTSQFPLAPARGTYDDETGDVVVTYPSWTLPTQSGNYTPAAGFVVAGWFAEAQNITSPIVTVELRVDGATVDQFTLTADAPADLHYFPTGYTGAVEPVIVSGACDFCLVEIAELWRYRPQPWDAYALLRLMSYQS